MKKNTPNKKACLNTGYDLKIMPSPELLVMLETGSEYYGENVKILGN